MVSLNGHSWVAVKERIAWGCLAFNENAAAAERLPGLSRIACGWTVEGTCIAGHTDSDLAGLRCHMLNTYTAEFLSRHRVCICASSIRVRAEGEGVRTLVLYSYVHSVEEAVWVILTGTSL